MKKLSHSKIIQHKLISETLKIGAFLAHIKKINNNAKFVMTNSRIISNINS